jgi:hypothetical protein
LKGDHPRIISAKFGWEFIKNHAIYVKKLIIMLMQFKFGGIFYELWTFADFHRLCKLGKRGDEIKKKSSPLKLLSQSQPNFAEMILGWSWNWLSSFIREDFFLISSPLFSNLHNRSKPVKVQSS